MNEIGLILKATEFAAIRHKAQFRKGEDRSQYINHPAQVSQSSDNAKKLKIADKIMNIRDVTNHPPNWWTLERILEYFDWSEKVVAGLRGVNKHLEMRFDEALENGRKKYSDHQVKL